MATPSATRSPSTGWRSIGAAHPDKLLRKGGAKAGDTLILTKRLGTGVLVSGHRQGKTSDEQLAAAVDQMRTLNRAASEVLVARGVRGATDVTGFGLLGHGLEMARGSGTRFVFEADALPALPGALELAADGVETGGAAHNRRFVAPDLTVANVVRPELVTLAHDPQTSGGLLAAVAPDALDDTVRALNAAGVQAWQVGRVEAGARRPSPCADGDRSAGSKPAGRGRPDERSGVPGLACLPVLSPAAELGDLAMPVGHLAREQDSRDHPAVGELDRPPIEAGRLAGLDPRPDVVRQVVELAGHGDPALGPTSNMPGWTSPIE